MSFHTQRPNAGHGRHQGAGEQFNDDEVTCERCGAGPFTWLHTGVRWRLVDERARFHQCADKPATTDDFD